MEYNNRGSINQSEPIRFTSRSIPISEEGPQSLFRAFSPPYFSWKPPNGPEFIAVGSVFSISADGNNRFDRAVTEATRLAPEVNYETTERAVARPRLFGGAAFDPDQTGSGPWADFQSLQFFLPRIQVTQLDDQSFLTITEPDSQSTTLEDTLQEVKRQLTDDEAVTRRIELEVGELTRSVTKAEWNTQIQNVKDRITGNEVQKVVLAQTLTARVENELDEPRILENLERAHPDCYQFLYSPSESNTVFGSSPEQLVKRKGLTIGTGALAGSIERGTSPIEDEDLAHKLCSRAKDQQEHALVKDEIMSNIKPYCTAIFCDNQRVRKLDSVQHLYTPIAGLLSKPVHILELVQSIHPSPAVGGIPPEEAAKIIKNTESDARGWYASPIGWFDFNGNGDFVVSIRSAVRHETEALLYAGAGIVKDSDPSLEWDEVQLKYQPVLDVLEP